MRCKNTQFLSNKHQNHQKIIQDSDNLTITHTIPRCFGVQKLRENDYQNLSKTVVFDAINRTLSAVSPSHEFFGGAVVVGNMVIN
mgnify:CR=1 FL=1